MSEIEKMYENAGVKPDHYHCEGCEYDYEDICPDDCPNSQVIYPPFTAEKQIELIKLLGNVRDFTVEIDKFKGVYYVGCRSAGSNDKLWGSSNVFEDALAELINETWFCLTEEEKQQIKEILNG